MTRGSSTPPAGACWNITFPTRAPTSVAWYLSHNRHNRAIPALLCGWEDGEPLIQTSIIGITKDIADVGVGLIVREPFAAKEAVVGFFLEESAATEAWFFHGVVERQVAIVDGFWLV